MMLLCAVGAWTSMLFRAGASEHSLTRWWIDVDADCTKSTTSELSQNVVANGLGSGFVVECSSFSWLFPASLWDGLVACSPSSSWFLPGPARFCSAWYSVVQLVEQVLVCGERGWGGTQGTTKMDQNQD